MKRLQVIPFVVASFITACSSESQINLDCTVAFKSRWLGETVEMIYPVTIDLDKGTFDDGDEETYTDVIIDDSKIYAARSAEDGQKIFTISRDTLQAHVLRTGTGMFTGSGKGHCVVAEKKQKF